MKLLFFTSACRIGQSLLMDRAYEGDKMRAAAKKLRQQAKEVADAHRRL